MDLAKIRKKSLRASEQMDEVFNYPPLSVLSPVITNPAPASAAILEKMDFFSQIVTPHVPLISSPVSAPVELPVAPTCSPLEAILAGRSAAGCDDEFILAEDASSPIISETLLEFLCFRVSDEIYGINIMDIKEIIKPREVTEVPRAPVFVSGVLSLRGTIIPIIDMRIRLGLSQAVPTGKERVVVIRNENTFSGLLVDEVIQVVQVPRDTIEAAPTILDGIDRDFVSGIGRSGNRLMIILNLEHITDINMY